MSVTASDIIIYGAANIAESNSGTQGGAIDTTVRYIFDDATLVNDPTASGGSGALVYVSDNAGDTMNITVTGREASGSIVSETKALTGTTPVNGTQVFERIMKIVLASSASGTVTVSDDNSNDIVDIESGVTTIRKPFYNISSDVVGGSTRDFYEKVFVKNNNVTFALLNATFAEQADPTTYVDFALEDAVSDSGTSTDRVTAPVAEEIGSSGFDSSSKTLEDETDAGTIDLDPSTEIGIWLHIQIPAGTSPAKSTYTLRPSGSTI